MPAFCSKRSFCGHKRSFFLAMPFSDRILPGRGFCAGKPGSLFALQRFCGAKTRPVWREISGIRGYIVRKNRTKNPFLPAGAFYFACTGV